ncbi:hypothetical protein GCM10028802_26250 [Terrabacter terrigena]
MRNLIAQAVKGTRGKTSAKRLLHKARPVGHSGSNRNFRRLVAPEKQAWRREQARAVVRPCGPRVSTWSSTGA